MAYTANIPQPTDQINNSQPQLLANFQAISTVVGINHVDFDDPTGDQGKHKFVEFPAENYTPPVITGEVTVYAPISAVTGVRELSVINQLGIETPITASVLSATPTPPMNSSGWSYYASGIKVVFCVTFPTVGAGVKNTDLSGLDAGFVFPNQIFRGMVGVYNPGASPVVNAVTVSWIGATSNSVVQWYASGSCQATLLIFGY
jgi:hypothetical protein